MSEGTNTPLIIYKKLIRDKIPAKMEADGAEYETRELDEQEFETELLKKVGEEASGLLKVESREEMISELADVLAVIGEIRKFKKISDEEIEEALKKAYDKKGGFDKRLFLEWASDTGYKTNERRNE